MAIRSEAYPAQTHSADVSILRPKIDRSVRRVDGIDMARELRGAHGPVLTPGGYLGSEEIEVDGVPLGEKMAELYVGADEQMNEAIGQKLEVLGYGE